MPSITQKLDELIKAAGGTPSGNGLPIDKKVEQATKALGSLSDVAEDYTMHLNKGMFNGGMISMDAKKSHEGLYTQHAIWAMPEGPICMCLLQTNYITIDTYQYSVLFLSVPEKYAVGNRYRVYRLRARPIAEEIDLTVDTSTDTGELTGDQSAASRYSRIFNLGTDLTPLTTELPYSVLRAVVELYDENGNLERRVYSPQVTVHKTNDSYEITTNYSFVDDDVVTYGFIYGRKSNTLDTMGGANGSRSLSELKSTKIAEIIYGQSGGTNSKQVYATKNASNLIPWSSLTDKRFIAPILVLGNDKNIIAGNCIRIDVPSFKADKAISNGDVFELDGLWYTATADIAQNATLVLGTNCEASTGVHILS